MTADDAPPGVNPFIPNAARMFDYYLGGKDNYAADRAAAEQVLLVAPSMPEMARRGREAIARFVTHLVAHRGITQIIDIGSGLPTRDNVHEIAHRIDPAVKVVYVDNDPMVCAHGRSLLAPDDGVRVLEGDLRRPAEILASPVVGDFLDLDRPVAVLMAFLLHLIPDPDDPQGAVAELREGLAPGSFIALTHASRDARPEFLARITAIYERANSPFVPRSRADVTRFFGDFELEPPGVVNVWPYPHPPAGMDADLAVNGYGGMGRKPGIVSVPSGRS